MVDTERPGSDETDAGAASGTAKTVAESLRSAGPETSGAEHYPMADTNQPGGPGTSTNRCATATTADLARASSLNSSARSAAAAIDRSHTMAHPGQGTSPGACAATTDTPDAPAGRRQPSGPDAGPGSSARDAMATSPQSGSAVASDGEYLSLGNVSSPGRSDAEGNADNGGTMAAAR